MKLQSITIGAAIALTQSGCGDIIGLNGYTNAADGSGEDAADGGTRDSATNDATDAAVTDTGTDAVADTGADSCVATTENCTNGTDDDCDGLVDCADSDCTVGFSCTPALPNGWAWAVYDQGARPACANGFATPKDVEEGINAAAATCGCGCTTTNPTCTTGNLTITAGTNGGCNNVTNQSRPAAAGCNTTNPAFATNNASISVTGPAPSGGSCAANPTSSVPAITYQSQGRTCAYTGSSGAGCSNGNVCNPTPAPFKACVSQAGMNACPNGFSVQHLIGSAITDTRGCTACTCAFNAGQCTGTATFFTNNGCTNNAQAVTADGACHGVANRTWNSYTYAPTNNASCAPSASNATGVAVFSDLTTVCCTN